MRRSPLSVRETGSTLQVPVGAIIGRLLEEQGHVLGIFVDCVAVIVFREEGSHQGRAFGLGQLSLPERLCHIRIRHLCAGMRRHDQSHASTAG